MQINNDQLYKKCVCVFVCVCVRACVRACVSAFAVNACVYAPAVLNIPYSWKISRAPIFKDFEVFLLSSKILSLKIFVQRL